MNNQENKIFIDTNCILSFIGQKYSIYKDPNRNTEAIHYLCKLTGKQLYISSLAVAQITATLQKKINNHDLRKEITNLLHRFKVVDFTQKDIENALHNKTQCDIEDLYQYSMSLKMNCMYLMTNNTKDFSPLLKVITFKPQDARKTICE